MPRSVHTDKYRRLIALMAGARETAGMTQVQLAAALGRPQSYVSKVERGERRIDVVEFCDWATALDENPAVLLAQFLAR